MMNLNAMKKAELINLINDQSQMIEALQSQNEALKRKLQSIKMATNDFIAEMTEIYTGNTNPVEVVEAVIDADTAKATTKAKDTIKDTKKHAPRNPEKNMEKTPRDNDEEVPDDKPEKPQTYQEGIDAWKIKKYGSIEVADRVDKMIPKARIAIREEAKKTRKYIPRDQYKTALYEKAFEMVKAEMEKEKAAKAKTKATKRTTKGATTTKGRATTKATKGTKKTA